jgi:hypothetical protein
MSYELCLVRTHGQELVGECVGMLTMTAVRQAQRRKGCGVARGVHQGELLNNVVTLIAKEPLGPKGLNL